MTQPADSGADRGLSGNDSWAPRTQAVQRRSAQNSKSPSPPSRQTGNSPSSRHQQPTAGKLAPDHSYAVNTLADDPRDAREVELPAEDEGIELTDSMAGILGTDAYKALGQYPGGRRRVSFRTVIRLAAAAIAVCALGYLCISALRATGSFSGGRGLEATDPRLESVHCDVPHPGRPLIQYVLMVDAGSTGSRIHVYKFNYCKANPELEDEIFEQLKPGLSSFKDDAQGAAHSLDKLMDVALKGVPESLRACTPVAVKATAGLRMLGAEASDRILKAVERHLRDDYPFRLVKDSPVEIMDGKYEGIYAWITVNFLLGTLGDAGHATAATFDLGGGSTQIVFEPARNATGSTELVAGAHRYDMSFGGQDYALYQHSYLGYGLMEARKTIKRMVAQDMSNNGRFSGEHPCFPPGFREEVLLSDGKSQVTIKGAKGASAGACYNEVRKMFNRSAPCTHPPCTFDGVYQPELGRTFANNPFYIFSYFYDRTYPLGVRDTFGMADFKALADKVCAYDAALFASKEQKDEVAAEPHYCLDLSFQYALLIDGVGMPTTRTVRSTRKIKGAETGWCLGASLAILSEDAYCRA
ncbi:Guanosine-diphosphatase [Coemansia biformis]|uniref:guanosine-diphosphatase n=1 Tax=Coemansia biformis TaxID=1286918 RepID=A0A9W7Y7I4_9FUNG|nr:Guanosine-diphosphatase [Coemansia biformis]